MVTLKHCSSLVSALASGTSLKSLDLEHAFCCVICRDGMNIVRPSLGRDVNWKPSVQGHSPPVQVKEPYISNLNSYL